jgi:hypothetical protein
MLDLKDIEILVQLICEKQTTMIKENHGSFADNEYIGLEILKVKLKEMEV